MYIPFTVGKDKANKNIMQEKKKKTTNKYNN